MPKSKPIEGTYVPSADVPTEGAYAPIAAANKPFEAAAYKPIDGAYEPTKDPYKPSESAYEPIQDAQRLAVSWTESPIGTAGLMLTLGALESIANDVAIDLLGGRKISPPWWSPIEQLGWKQPRPPIVRWEISDARSDSLHILLAPWILSALQQEDVRAVLQGLASSMVWAIGSSVQKKFERKPERPTPNVFAATRDILIAAQDTLNGQKGKIRIFVKTADGTEVNLWVDLE